VFDAPPKEPTYTGLVTEYGEPICRFFMPKPGIGFLAEDVEVYHPGAYAYGLHPISFENGEYSDEFTGNEDNEDETEELDGDLVEDP
jgi:hypothetical protein